MTNVRTTAARRRLAVLAPVLIVAFSSGLALTAQTPARKALTVEDYTRWRSISSSDISSDGAWVAYGVQQTNVAPTETKPVLHLLKLDTNLDVAIADATGGTFSADAKWMAYQVDPGGGRGGRGNRGGAASPAPGSDTTVSQTTPAGGQGAQARGGNTPPTPPRRVELRNLSTGAVQSWQDIQSFTFAANSTYLILRRRPPAPANGAGRGSANAPAETPAGGGGNGRGAETPAGPRGVDVILHNLATGRDQLLGSVGDIAFNKIGELLAYTWTPPPRDSNGLFVLDLRNGRVNALDNDAKIYDRLTWNDDGTALAVLKGLDVDKMRERNNVLLAFPNVQAALGEAEPAPDRARSGESRGVSGQLGRQRSRAARLERRRQARVLRHEGAGARAGHGPAEEHGRGRRRRRVEHAGRAHPVGPDDSRRRRSQLHVPRGVRRRPPASSCSWPTRRCAISRSRRTAAGPSAATRAATSPTTSARPRISIASTPRPASGR